MIKFFNADKAFKTIDGIKSVFRGLNLKIEEGDFITLIGSNGAGKSTLIKLISGDLELDGGSIMIDSKDVTEEDAHLRKQNIACVYQNPELGTAYNMTVYENLSLADNKGKAFGLKRGLNKRRKAFYKEVLAELNLGLESQMNTLVGDLSGGQRQAVSLIMSILNPPKLLLLDEFTSALDPVTAEVILKKTSQIIKERGITTLMITHNLQDAIDYGNRLIMLKNGKVEMDVDKSISNIINKETLVNALGI